MIGLLGRGLYASPPLQYKGDKNMKSQKFNWKRPLSCLLSMLLLLSAFPGTAMAAPEDNTYSIYTTHWMADENGEIDGNTLQSGSYGQLGDSTLAPADFVPAWDTSEQTIDLWVTSSTMKEDGKDDGSAVPYVRDKDGHNWYLQKIEWTNTMGPDKPDEVSSGEILSSDKIKEAASSSDKDAYQFTTSAISGEPYNEYGTTGYFIWYYWTQIPPDFWGLEELPAQYNISYNLNIPTNVTTLYTVLDDGIPRPVEGDGNLTQVKQDVAKLASSVYEGQSYTVSDFTRDYTGFLVFNNKMEQYTYDEYYEFAGWTVGTDEDQKVFQIGEVIPDIAELSEYADEQNNIEFTAKWEKITPLNDDQLNALLSGKDKLPLNLIARGKDVSTNNLMVQWTDEDKNEHSNTPGKKTGDIVTIDQDGQIHYRVTAIIDSGFTSAAGTYKEEFADLTITIHIDDKLEFVTDSSGQVTLTVDPGPLKLKDIDWTNIPGAQKTENTITFASSNIPQDGDIELYFNWDPKGNQSDPINITGLDFKLKEDVQVSQDFNIECWANISGSLDYYNQTEQNPRFHYEAAWTALNSERSWQEAFPGGLKSPVAFVHALQFMDTKLKDFDLRKDEQDKGTAPIIKTSANAVIVESTPVTLTPADMTIYMGGDGGYDAVVNEDGHTVTSNSLPHPIFQLDGAPSGVTFNNQTFTNAESGNSWKLVPETGASNYYHFENEAGTKVGVRVQYSNENGAVTSDKFDPATEKDVFTEYDVSVYTGDTKGIVTAVASDGKNYLINTDTGTLTVRAVENSDPTSPIVTEVPTSVKSGSATAVVPTGGTTTYTLNNTGVQLPEDAKPSLLFDEIISSDGKGDERINKLQEAADTKLGGANENREYQIKYLDLVDANNGNAWIKASGDVTIYWGYPKGTDQSTDFKLLHFEDLHRDTSGGGTTGFDPDDIANSKIETIAVTNNSNGISFTVGSGGFSPFVLVWETAAEPTPDPDPNPGGGSGGGSDSDPTGNLTISLGGNGGNEDFIFTVIFTDEDGDELENNFYYNGDYTGTIGSGDEITLTDGDKIVIRNLPEGTRYEVIIETADGYAVTSTGAEGVIRTSGNEAAFSVTPTVVLADPSVTGVTRWLNTTDHIAYLTGYPGGAFGPDNSMTRAEVAQMFYALLLNKDVTITKTFSDVPADAWYATAVNTLASLGMVSGDPEGTFRPNDPITRAEFCVIALAFAYEPDNAVCYFGDVSRSDWFYTYVAQAASYGWIGGYTNGNFGPNDQITRAQVTTIVNNMLGRAADRDYVIDHQADLVQFSDLTRTHWGYFQIMEATNAHDYTKSDGIENWR